MPRLRHLILGLSLLASAAGSQSRPAGAALAEGLAELNRGNVLGAIGVFKQIARSDPSPAAAYFYLSGIYTRMGRFDAAYRYLESAMTRSPGQGAYYHQLGVIRRSAGCRSEALESFHQALQSGMGKDEAAVWHQIGDVQVDMLAWDKAIEAYQHALRLEPGDAPVRLALGRLYLDRGDPQRAIPELRAALRLSPDSPGAHASLGRAYRAHGDLESAVSVLQDGVARNPADQESRYVLGQVLLTLGRDNEGRRTLAEYRGLQDRLSKSDSLFEAAIGRAQAGDLDRAETLLKETLSLAPRYAPALQALGTVRLTRGNISGALEMLQQALTSNPLDPETYFSLGAAHLHAGRLSDALDMTERALMLEEEDPRYRSQLAEIYSGMNRPAEARAAMEQAAALRARPGYRPLAPYSSDMRHRDATSTVRRICGDDPGR